ncbi:TetR family transcriptional regulator [Thermocatellispora tengchongensis]
MSGLLDAVAAHGFATYLHDKHALAATDDPVADLRRGWDLHVSFGLTRPAFYILMYGEPRPGATSHAAAEAMAILRRTITRIAESGLLRVPVDRAATMLHSACMGVTFTLIGTEPRSRDPHLSEQTREAVIAAVTTTPQPSTPQPLRASVLTLRAALTTDQAPELSSLTPAERTLLAEWLDRLVH